MIHIPYWWHASLFEILWLVGGVAAGVLSGLNLRDAWKDNEILEAVRFDESLHKREYEMITISAHGRMAAQGFRLGVSTLIVFAGAVGIATANPLRGATTLTGLTVTVALVGISLATAAIAYLDLIRRKRLYELSKGRTNVIAARRLAEHLINTEELDDRR